MQSHCAWRRSPWEAFWRSGAPGLSADFAVNMTPGVTAISREVYDLHMLIFWICVAIGAVVFGVMFWSIYHHRKSRGAVAAQFHESTLVEVLWTIVPMLILVAMAVPATKTLIRMADARGCRFDHQGHWLSVALALRVSERRHRLLQHPGHAAGPDSQHCPQGRNIICWRWIGGWWCRSARKSAF